MSCPVGNFKLQMLIVRVKEKKLAKARFLENPHDRKMLKRD